MNPGTWRATARGVTKAQTHLSNYTTTRDSMLWVAPPVITFRSRVLLRPDPGNAPTVPLAWSFTAEVGSVGNSSGVARQCQGRAGCPCGFCSHLLAGDLPSASMCKQQPGTAGPRADDDPTADASGAGADGALRGEASPRAQQTHVPVVDL